MLNTTPRPDATAALPAALADSDDSQDAILHSADLIDLRDRYKAALLRARTMDRLDVALQKADTVNDILRAASMVARFLTMPRPRLVDPTPRTPSSPKGAPSASEWVTPTVPPSAPVANRAVTPSVLATARPVPGEVQPPSTTAPNAAPSAAPPAPLSPPEPSVIVPAAPTAHNTAPRPAPADTASRTTAHPPFV